MKLSNFRKQLITLTGAAAVLTSGAVFAQQSGGGEYEPQSPQYNQQSPQQQQQQQNFADEDLKAFAEAQSEVNKISQEFQQKAQNADDQSQLGQLRQEANREMVEVVQDAGLETDKFNQIAKAVRTNPNLAAKIENM